MTAPPALEESRLEDDIGSVAHRRQRRRLRRAESIWSRQSLLLDGDDPLARGTKSLEVRKLVSVAPVLHQLDGEILAAMRAFPQPFHPAEL